MSARGQVKLVAMLRHASPTGFRNAVALMVAPSTNGKTLDELLKSNENAMEKISEPGSMAGRLINLPSGPAIRIQFNHLRPSALTTAIGSYWVHHDNQAYAFSFVSHLGDQDDWRATAQ